MEGQGNDQGLADGRSLAASSLPNQAASPSWWPNCFQGMDEAVCREIRRDTRRRWRRSAAVCRQRPQCSPWWWVPAQQGSGLSGGREVGLAAGAQGPACPVPHRAGRMREEAVASASAARARGAERGMG